MVSVLAMSSALSLTVPPLTGWLLSPLLHRARAQRRHPPSSDPYRPGPAPGRGVPHSPRCPCCSWSWRGSHRWAGAEGGHWCGLLCCELAAIARDWPGCSTPTMLTTVLSFITGRNSPEADFIKVKAVQDDAGRAYMQCLQARPVMEHHTGRVVAGRDAGLVRLAAVRRCGSVRQRAGAARRCR